MRDRVNEAIEAGELVDIIDEWLSTASAMSGIASSFGNVFADQVLSPLEANVNGLLDQLDVYTLAIEDIAATLGLDPNSGNFFFDLFWLARTGTAEQQGLANLAMQLFDDRTDLTNELAAAQDELIAQQERLLELEQKRADLDFLRQQYELIKLIQENNLDASILEGLTFGVDADAGSLMDAMIEAMQQMIGAVEKELGINSPSTWAVGLMRNVFDALAMTAEAESDALERSVRRALSPTLEMGDATGGRGSHTVDNSRRVTNYGGIHVHGDGRRRSAMDVLQEQLV